MEWYAVAREDAVGETPLVCQAAGIELILVRVEDSIHAVENRCPHMGSPLTNAVVRRGRLLCTWHHWEFDLACGQRFANAEARCTTYPVREDEGTVLVGIDLAQLPPSPGGFPRPGIDPPYPDGRR